MNDTTAWQNPRMSARDRIIGIVADALYAHKPANTVTEIDTQKWALALVQLHEQDVAKERDQARRIAVDLENDVARLTDELANCKREHTAFVLTAGEQIGQAQAEAELQRRENARLTAPTCICGHPVRQHFEDACLDCDCGDCMEPEVAREEIRRLVQIVRQRKQATS